MHDPMTVAFDIKYPWRQKPSQFWPEGYRETFATIWHVDPEKDGTDDSCGWSYPKPPKKLVDELAGDLQFVCRHVDDGLARQQAREGGPMWLLLWLQRASFYDRRRSLSPSEMARALYAHSFPGNRDDSWNVADCEPSRLAWSIGRVYRDLIRPWWRHPRWHVWHWRIQVHPLQQFKRWAFSRCCWCGGRFDWGEQVIGYSWHGTGPRWLRGEPQVSHFACDGQHAQRPSTVPQTTTTPSS